MIVAIIGRIRSGTSAVAELVHNLGIPVAAHMPAPLPPTYRSDWEDSELSITIQQGKVTDDWMTWYLKKRLEVAHATGWVPERIALKSPFLPFHWSILKDSCGRIGHELRTIEIWRDDEAVLRSLEPWPNVGPRENEQIARKMMLIKSDLKLGYEDLVARPYHNTRRVAKLLGITDDEAVTRAAKTVKAPTTIVFEEVG